MEVVCSKGVRESKRRKTEKMYREEDGRLKDEDSGRCILFGYLLDRHGIKVNSMGVRDLVFGIPIGVDFREGAIISIDMMG